MISLPKTQEEIKSEILNLIDEYFKNKPEEKFIPGKTRIGYNKSSIASAEIRSALNPLLDTWIPEGKNTFNFEDEFAKFNNVKDSVVTVSGSAALLLSFAALKEKSLQNPLKEGDEVLTTALAFPTTINAIILNALKPYFIDVDETYNMDLNLLESVLNNNNTKIRAILVTHHLGNPCNMQRLMEIAKKYNLYVVEDACDAHGAEYNGKKAGSFGDLGCFSFYGAHAMTMGEGGAVISNNEEYLSIIRSLKTCGVACSCKSCAVKLAPNTKCTKRWRNNIDGLEIKDGRTIYPFLGYKLKTIDVQSAIGLEQLKRLPEFIRKRKENFDWIVKRLGKFNQYLMLTKETENSYPSWFAIPISVKPNAKFDRDKLVSFLEEHNIETRPLLGGNLLKHPAYKGMKFNSTKLDMTDYFHSSGFYIGCHPFLTQEMKDYIISVFEDFFKKV